VAATPSILRPRHGQLGSSRRRFDLRIHGRGSDIFEGADKYFAFLKPSSMHRRAVDRARARLSDILSSYKFITKAWLKLRVK
jgi:hypothetical protein